MHILRLYHLKEKKYNINKIRKKTQTHVINAPLRNSSISLAVAFADIMPHSVSSSNTEISQVLCFLYCRYLLKVRCLYNARSALDRPDHTILV